MCHVSVNALGILNAPSEPIKQLLKQELCYEMNEVAILSCFSFSFILNVH